VGFKSKIKDILVWVAVFAAVSGFAQIPPGYYNGTEGLSGESLRSALFGIIHDHTELTYASLWTHFQSTDRKPDGSVWDMYSDVPGGNPAYTYTFVVDQCGNYGAEGDCYNREHSFPKSWFNDAAPMVTDLFHIYPTDGYVNGQRSNYPYGEVGNASWTSTNGSKVGNSSFAGYPGIVFEPIDAYKGDFARTYFYMVTCYLDQVSTWSSPMLSGNNLSDWARDMLVQWSYADPVSIKETERNDAVYEVQDNRNPYIDHPEWVGAIWGLPTSVSEMSSQDITLWYSNNQIHFRQTNARPGELIITNLSGQQIRRYRVDQPSIAYTADLIPGIYFMTFLSPDIVFSQKVMVSCH